MSSGVLIYSFDSESVPYSKIANLCALFVRAYLELPISVVTDKKEGLDASLFDNIILKEKRVSDIRWRNTEREDYFELTPYDETLVIDSDYFLFNRHLRNLFDTHFDFILSKKALKSSLNAVGTEEARLNPVGIDMLWATCFYFKKNEVAKEFFELVNYIKENYLLYYNLYKIKTKTYRNDYVFSIAYHIHRESTQEKPFYNPYPLYTAFRETEIVKCYSSGLVLFDKEASVVENMKGLSLHVLNKQTILEHYDDIRRLFI